MSETLSLQNGVEDIVSSYETKIENIDSLFDPTQFIFSEFQGDLLKLNHLIEEINAQLRDVLAKNENLRKKDFDRMTQGILSIQIEEENEIRDVINSYFAEQRQMIALLRDHLAKIKEALAKGQTQEAKESQDTMTQILTYQDKRKQEVSLKLKAFQKSQGEMTERFLELLAQGRELRINDLKSMLRDFAGCHKERLARQGERKQKVQKRKEAVHSLLLEFKKKRMESFQNSLEKHELNIENEWNHGSITKKEEQK